MQTKNKRHVIDLFVGMGGAGSRILQNGAGTNSKRRDKINTTNSYFSSLWQSTLNRPLNKDAVSARSHSPARHVKDEGRTEEERDTTNHFPPSSMPVPAPPSRIVSATIVISRIKAAHPEWIKSSNLLPSCSRLLSSRITRLILLASMTIPFFKKCRAIVEAWGNFRPMTFRQQQSLSFLRRPS